MYLQSSMTLIGIGQYDGGIEKKTERSGMKDHHRYRDPDIGQGVKE